MSINHVVLSGRLTADIDVRSTAGGLLVGSFSLAINEYYNQKEHVSFINCTAFGKTVERLQKYSGKGSSVAVEGFLRQERWETKEGENRSRIAVVVNKVEIFDFKQRDTSKDQNNFSEPQKKNDNFYEDTAQDFMDDDDIPF